MTFNQLQQRLLDDLRLRVRNGESTERGLAKAVGMSQTHLHNVLKGKRLLSIEKTDDVLRYLRLGVLDLAIASDKSRQEAGPHAGE